MARTGRTVRLLDGVALRSLLDLDAAVPAVEAAYVAHSRGEAMLFPVIRETLPGGSGVFGIKTGMWPAVDTLGFKAAGYWPGNRERGLENHQALVVLVDPATGVARTIMDGNWVTAIRTAAAGAIAARRMARPDSRLAVVVGSGIQAAAQARALAWWRPELEIAIWEPLDGPDRAAATRLAETLGAEGIAARASGSLELDIRAADVVVTATPSTRPLVRRAWLTAGCHVNAMGADTRGKQEHEVETLRAARVIVDDWPQARTLGECQHAVAAGLFATRPPDTIGEVIAGDAVGRADPDEITLFDATGIALQDLAVAALAERLAQERGLGVTFDLG